MELLLNKIFLVVGIEYKYGRIEKARMAL